MYRISGIVVRGAGYGREIGFPTANLKIEKGGLPSDGVYAGSAEVEGIRYRAGIVVGPGEKIEAHILGFSGDIYGKTVIFETEKFLREFKKFDTEEELKAQIKRDLEQC